MYYLGDDARYESMHYNVCKKTGLKLPAVSLGMWQNFGGKDNYENARAILLRSFDLGITYFDISNNYGMPKGSAEETFGRVLKADFARYRDEMIITTKVGYDMWQGPYGAGGTRKHIIASTEQSLRRIGIDYVDVLYSHRFDADTPLEETIAAFDLLIRQGKALYIGFSTGYSAKVMEQIIEIASRLGTPCAFHMSRYSMFNREPEAELQTLLHGNGYGSIAFSPLAEGALTDKYLNGIPAESRASKNAGNTTKYISEQAKLEKVVQLNRIAKGRGQSLAQLAIAWVLREGRSQSALVGASRVSQIEDSVAALNRLDFSSEELEAIECILRD
ncbi:aldo/keto reductase [Paenibacillus oryzisoli]|uniref:L-glyceraldehyde 3-phosphate reductase n=1 Tax=Paenibacillus oryzisoli TaxID=1850517 RepID=A0A198A102_9BACL|nr:aldo/keto reductase [Paenibacillus oryzisoli]OAS14860.1 L-glyceraldehyde 3-phosphate reductase [Paenibacillus oryzisoli]